MLERAEATRSRSAGIFRAQLRTLAFREGNSRRDARTFGRRNRKARARTSNSRPETGTSARGTLTFAQEEPTSPLEARASVPENPPSARGTPAAERETCSSAGGMTTRARETSWSVGPPGESGTASAGRCRRKSCFVPSQASSDRAREVLRAFLGSVGGCAGFRRSNGWLGARKFGGAPGENHELVMLCLAERQSVSRRLRYLRAVERATRPLEPVAW
jgi:hypothetical protein